jgi:hypothetical protein
MSDDRRPILALDFDGVVFRYSRGWQGGELYEGATEGFFDWALRASEVFRLVIFSSRSRTTEGIIAMEDWLNAQMAIWAAASGKRPTLSFEFSDHKPPAFITVDDRCIRFDGDWSAPALDPGALRLFKPWTAK